MSDTIVGGAGPQLDAQVLPGAREFSIPGHDGLFAGRNYGDRDLKAAGPAGGTSLSVFPKLVTVSFLASSRSTAAAWWPATGSPQPSRHRDRDNEAGPGSPSHGGGGRTASNARLSSESGRLLVAAASSYGQLGITPALPASPSDMPHSSLSWVQG